MMQQLLQLSQALNLNPSEDYMKIATELEDLANKLNSKTPMFGGIFTSSKITQKGFYIYGSTGSGKTTLMNAFFREVNNKKLNIHFHDYFLDIARLLTKYSMSILVKKLAKKVKVLCFDEFFIESMADARLLEDLFEGLIGAGVVIILTSNFIPEKLYENGFNREVIFPKFSDFLRQNLTIFNLSNSFDFREKLYAGTSLMVQNLPQNFVPTTLEFQNHKISCKSLNNEAIFEYEELFARPRGIVEFIYIARQFDTIYIANFTRFLEQSEDQVIRFRNFIDITYIRHNILYLQGDFTEDDIFPEKFLINIEIKRTYSRLKEMSSHTFLSQENLLKRSWQTEARILLENL